MGSEEESRTPPLPQLSEDDQQYTPPKMIQSVVKIVQSKKVKKSDRSSKKKIKKHKKSTKHSDKSKKSSKNDALSRSCQKSTKETIRKPFVVPEIFQRRTEVQPAIIWSENPRYFIKSSTPPPPKSKKAIVEIPAIRKSLSPATPPLPVRSKSPDTDEYETKWESDEDSALRRNLDDYYLKIGQKFENDKLKASSNKIEEKLEPTSLTIESIPIDETVTKCDKKKFSMSLKKPENLGKFTNPFIKPKIFLDEAIDEEQPKCDIIETKIDSKKIDEKKIDKKKTDELKIDEKRRNRSSSRDDRRPYKRRSPSRDRRQRRGERGERKKNDDDYEFTQSFAPKKPDQKLNEIEAAKCSQVLSDYLNPGFPQSYMAPPPPPPPPITNGNSPKMQWSSLDARLEQIKNGDQPQQTINYNQYYTQAYQESNFYYQPNYAMQSIVPQINPNLISIQSQEPTPSFVVVGNVLEIVPTAQPPLPPTTVTSKPPPPPPESPQPVPPPIGKSPRAMRIEAKRLRKEKKLAEREENLVYLRNEIKKLRAAKENRVRAQIEKDLEGIPVETRKPGILLDRTIPQSAGQPFDICRSFREEKALRGDRPQKSVIYRDTVRPNYDENELQAEMLREKNYLLAYWEKRWAAEEKLKETELKKQKLYATRKKKTSNLMEGFKVPKPTLKSSTCTSATSSNSSDISHEPRKPESADLKDLAFYYNLPPPGPPPGRPPPHLPQPTLKNPEPDKHLYFHAYPNTGQMVISPFPEEPDWPLIVGKLKDDGTALVCTPNMIQRDPRCEKIRAELYKNLPPQPVPPPFKPLPPPTGINTLYNKANYFGPRPLSLTGIDQPQVRPPLSYFGPRPPFNFHQSK